MYSITNRTVTEGTVTEPVTLAEIKEWLQIDFTDFDDLLTDMGKGARIALETWLAQPLVTKTIEFDVITDPGYVQLPLGTADAVGVTYLDTDDTETALTDGEDYFFRTSQIRFSSSGRYHVTYDCNAIDITEQVKEAIKMEVAERFQNRGESPSGMSEAAKQKVVNLRMIWL